MDTEEPNLVKLTDSEVLVVLVTDMEFLGLIKFPAIIDRLRRYERATIQQDNAASKAACCVMLLSLNT